MLREFIPLWSIWVLPAGCLGSAPALVSPSPVVRSPVAPPVASSPVASSPSDRSALALEVTATLRGSRAAVLRTGDEVVSDDDIQVAVQPTVDAHVYVAYCDRDSRLTIFPNERGIAAAAGAITRVPAPDMYITLDHQVGAEVLYVIASRWPLDAADPALAAAISRARPDAAVECGEPLDRVIRNGRRVLPRPIALPEQRGDPDPLGHPPPAKPGAPRRAAAASDPDPPRNPPPATLERGAFIRWGASGPLLAGGDHKDIVIVRYGFTHVAGPRRVVPRPRPWRSNRNDLKHIGRAADR